jgi:hypothetical protein
MNLIKLFDCIGVVLLEASDGLKWRWVHEPSGATSDWKTKDDAIAEVILLFFKLKTLDELIDYTKEKAEQVDSEESVSSEDLELYDTPLEEVKSGLRRSLAEAKSGQRIPLAQMWEGIDEAVESSNA